MSNTTKILYSGFYDYPLAFTARYKGTLYVFVRDFDDEQDEYESEYRVFVLPPWTDEEIQSSWLHIESKATAALGTVAVADISFDATHRKEIATDILDQISAAASHCPREELAGAFAK